MFGEPKLISLSLFLTGISLVLLPFIKGDGQLKWLAVLRATDWPWIKMLLALALLAVGSAAFRIVVQPRACERAGRDHRRRTKRREPGAHSRPAVRRDALHPRRAAALRDLRCHFHPGWSFGDAAAGQMFDSKVGRRCCAA